MGYEVRTLKPMGRAIPFTLRTKGGITTETTDLAGSFSNQVAHDLTSPPFPFCKGPPALLRRFCENAISGCGGRQARSAGLARVVSCRGSCPAHTGETTTRRGCKGTMRARRRRSRLAAAQPAPSPFCRPARFSLPAGRPSPLFFPARHHAMRERETSKEKARSLG